MEKDVNNLYYFYSGNAASFVGVTSFIIEYMDGMKRTVTEVSHPLKECDKMKN